MCSVKEELWQQYLDNDLEPLEKIILEEHLAGCRQCRRVLNQLKVLEWDLNHLPVPEIPAELTQIRKAVLDSCFEEQKKSGVSLKRENVAVRSYHHMKKSMNFVHYLPGNQALQKAADKVNVSGIASKTGRALLAKVVGIRW